MTKATKKDALDAAIRLLAQGMKEVTINDEKGQQIYSTSVDLIEIRPRNSRCEIVITCSRRFVTNPG
jgi:hypothetical protein